jgi:hypothetical protein
MVDTPTILITEASTNLCSVGISTETGQQRAIDLSDKLTIVNQALINTGNNPVNVGDDTSDEWRVASSGFDQSVLELLYERNWNFATRIQQLNRFGDSQYPGFADVFAKPADCLYLQNVYRLDLALEIFPSLATMMPDQDIMPPPLAYRIVGDQIHCVAAAGAMSIYLPFPVGAQPWSVGFVKALRFKVEAIIYRGLNEDMQAAMGAMKAAEGVLSEAAARVASEEPRKVVFISGALEARRRRFGRGW